MVLRIKKVRVNAKMPQRATLGSAGMDLTACCEEPLTIQPMQRVLIPTGIAVEMEDSSCVGLLFARSGLALREGLALANGVGVIDSDYRGEISVPAVNLSSQPIRVSDGERVAQLVILPVMIPEIQQMSDLSDTERGAGGFGSTGKK